jgi:hypothetical protein
MIEGSGNPDPYLALMDQDPGGPLKYHSNKPFKIVKTRKERVGTQRIKISI